MPRVGEVDGAGEARLKKDVMEAEGDAEAATPFFKPFALGDDM